MERNRKTTSFLLKELMSKGTGHFDTIRNVIIIKILKEVKKIIILLVLN